MIREEFLKNHKKNLDDFDIKQYHKRLNTPYIKNGQQKDFLTQYNNGDGNELSSHFWSAKSSSRFAFELYSWMASSKKVDDIEVEKKLTGIAGSKKKPNMDVFIEIGNRVIFIESKLTEAVSQDLKKLSDSYYLPLGESKNSKTTLEHRYHDQTDIAYAIHEFICDFVMPALKAGNYPSCWMDYKQEITHLIGILLDVTLNKNNYYKDKDIEFYNIYYDFEDEEYDFINEFFKKANNMVNDLLVKKGLCKSFTYKRMTAQEMVKSGKIIRFDQNTKSYASNKTIGETLFEQFDFKIE